MAKTSKGKKFVKQSKKLRYIADQLGVKYTELMSSQGLMLAIIDEAEEALGNNIILDHNLKTASARISELEAAIKTLRKVVDG